MFHTKSTASFLSKKIIVLSAIMLLVSSCTTITKLPKVPENIDESKKVNIKLITVNEGGFEQQFGGSYSERTCIFPYWSDAVIIGFNDEFGIAIDGDWETSNGKYFGKKFKLNDKAVFSIPAGIYKVCLYKMSDYGKSTNPIVLKKCYDKSPFQFDGGGNYEMYIYFLKEAPEDSLHRMAITEIRKVKEFKATSLFSEK